MGKEDIAVNTIIGKGASFDGLLEISGGLRVDGTLKGKIHNADIIFVGPSGTLEADVEAKECIVGGVVKGNIKAPDKVELQAKSQVEGDIITYSLVVEQGAVFHGNCQMKKQGQPATPSHLGARPQTHTGGFQKEDTLVSPQKAKV
jgi:cytoskeletal protein CcmA (bactofilin family)